MRLTHHGDVQRAVPEDPDIQTVKVAQARSQGPFDLGRHDEAVRDAASTHDAHHPLQPGSGQHKLPHAAQPARHYHGHDALLLPGTPQEGQHLWMQRHARRNLLADGVELVVVGLLFVQQHCLAERGVRVAGLEDGVEGPVILRRRYRPRGASFDSLPEEDAGILRR